MFWPLFAADFEASTASWSCGAVGAYIRLLNHSWLNNGIPSDPKRLRRIVRCDAEEWDEIWQEVSAKWAQGPDGLLRNPRQEKVREDQTARYDQRVQASKRAAAKRRNEPTGIPTGTPTGIPTGTPSGTPTGTPSGTPSGIPPDPPPDPPNHNHNHNYKNTSPPDGGEAFRTRSAPAASAPADEYSVRTGEGWLLKPTWRPSEDVISHIRIRNPAITAAFIAEQVPDFLTKYGEAPQRDPAWSSRFTRWVANAWKDRQAVTVSDDVSREIDNAFRQSR